MKKRVNPRAPKWVCNVLLSASTSTRNEGPPRPVYTPTSCHFCNKYDNDKGMGIGEWKIKAGWRESTHDRGAFIAYMRPQILYSFQSTTRYSPEVLCALLESHWTEQCPITYPRTKLSNKVGPVLPEVTLRPPEHWLGESPHQQYKKIKVKFPGW